MKIDIPPDNDNDNDVNPKSSILLRRSKPLHDNLLPTLPSVHSFRIGTFVFHTRAALSLLFWFISNIMTLVLNKWMYKNANFSYPLSLTAIHMIACSIGSLITIHLIKLVRWHRLDLAVISKEIVPLACLFIFNIVLGNISLRWISVSFMQTIKSSVPVFNVFIQVLFWKKSFDNRIYFSLIPIVGGVMLATYTESEFQTTGFWAAIIASFTTALFAIVSGIILSKKLDSLNLTYYISPISFLLLLPFCDFLEFSDLRNNWWPNATSNDLGLLIINGTIAYLLNITSFFVIVYTSPLTYNIAGNFKVIFSITISVWIFGNKITALNAFGCIIAISGVAYYNWLRQRI